MQIEQTITAEKYKYSFELWARAIMAANSIEPYKPTIGQYQYDSPIYQHGSQIQ